MSLRDAVLLGIVCIGAIGGAIYYATRIQRSTFAVLGMEARFLDAELRVAGPQLGLALVSMPVFHDPRTPPEQRWPDLPFLCGQRGKFQIVVAPDYYWALTRTENEDFDLQHLDLVVRLAHAGAGALAPGLPTAAAPGSPQLRDFWDAQQVRQGPELKASKDTPACESLVKRLCDTGRRPMRVASIRRLPDLVQAVIAYPDAPKVAFEGSELRAPVDVTALDQLLSELVQTAETCPRNP